MATCLTCGGPAVNGLFGYRCAACDQVKLLKEQNKIRREQLKVQQEAYKNQSFINQTHYENSNESFYENNKNYAHSGNDSSDDAIGTILAIGIGILMLVGIYKFLAWLFGWIWAIVTWPFKFTWQSFENVIAGSTQLIGISHQPPWWEVSILIAVVSFGLICLWNYYPSSSNITNHRNFENRKIGITAIIFILLIASGIWFSPKSKISASAVSKIIQTQENSPEHSTEKVSKDLTPKYPSGALTLDQK